VPAACLAAADPVCLALLATRAVPDGDPAPDGNTPAMERARLWQAAVRRAARRGHPMALAYLRVAGLVSRLFLTSLSVQEALAWLARHVRALLESGDVDLWRRQDHGALVDRIRHTLDTIMQALGSDDAEAAVTVRALETVFADTDAGAAVATFLASAFRPVEMAADGEKGESRAIAHRADALGRGHRRRSPRRDDRDRGLERRPLARPDLSRAVHRSPR
jgi:hypothetical protein